MQNLLKPVDVFVCFSQEDSKWYMKLQQHSGPMIKQGTVRYWSEQDIIPGVEVRSVIEEMFYKSEIIIFLMTPALMLSNTRIELMNLALERQQRGDAAIIPVFVKPIDWSITPFSSLQHVPMDGRPISQRRDRDIAYLELAQTIHKLIAGRRVPVKGESAGPAGTQRDSQSSSSGYRVNKPDNRTPPKNGSLGFLHLSDLHVCQEGQSWLWPGFRKQFFDDLTIIHKHAGPFDVVFFTGDLVFSGKEKEFLELDKVISDIWGHLKTLGSDPVLLPIPGNHDLQRPSEAENVLEFAGLHLWHDPKNGKKVRELLLSQQAALADNSLRKMVLDSFADYVQWQNRILAKMHRSNISNMIKGILPGDFTLSLNVENLKIGIMGLNSAFLQLTGGDFEGHLDLRLEQFHAACGGDAHRWIESHDGCILLTHQPPDWLHPQTRETYLAEIYTPKNFMVHLFGHMHHPASQSISQGGAQARNMVQGASLFGLESYVDINDSKTSRIHGYSAGRIIRNEDHIALRIFPRIRVKKQGNLYGLVADPSFSLDEYGAYEIGVR